MWGVRVKEKPKLFGGSLWRAGACGGLELLFAEIGQSQVELVGGRAWMEARSEFGC